MPESNLLFDEKPPADCPEPLVLRPPVGGEVYGIRALRFSPFRDWDAHRRRRMLVLCSFTLLLASAICAGVLFALFFLGVGSPSIGSCRRLRFHVFLPSMDFTTSEDVTLNNEMLNISLTEPPPMQKVYILHLIGKGLTVIRTPDHCFIRPTRSDLREALDAGYVNRLKSGNDFRSNVRATVKKEMWFAQPPDPTLSVLEDPLVASWCDGVPAFRLVSRNPYDDYPSESSPENQLEESEAIMNLINRQGRYRRDVSKKLSESEPVDKETHCKTLEVLEDATISSSSGPEEVEVTQDVIRTCNAT